LPVAVLGAVAQPINNASEAGTTQRSADANRRRLVWSLVMTLKSARSPV
jgi:hypothetical protein